MTLSAIESALGGPRTLQHTLATGADLIDLTRKGIPSSILNVLAANLAVDRQSVARTLGIAPRTLNRRLRHNARLTAEESDRAVRLARILAFARQVLSSDEKAAAWLQTPNFVLSGVAPYTLLDTDPGTETVEAVLGRIAYGIYS